MLKKKFLTIAALLGALMLVFALAGCGNSSSADPTSPPNDGGNDPSKTVTGITVTSPPTKTTYGVGEPFDSAGMTVDAQYEDGSSVPLTINSNMLSCDFSKAGTKNVTITYQDKTATTPVTVLSLVDRIKAIQGTTATITLYADEKLEPNSISTNNMLTDGTNLTLIGSGAIRTISHTSAGFFLWLIEGVTLTLDNNITIDNKGISNSNTMLYFSNGGKLVMKNGATITGANSGGAVFLNNGGTFEMQGGAIAGNQAWDLWYNAGVNLYHGTFTMTGGTITNNTSVMGGGLLNDQSTVTISGGSIKGNHANLYGDDILVYGATTSLSGTAQIGNITLMDSTINIASGFTNIGTIDLTHDKINDLAAIKTFWVNRQIITPASGTINPNDFISGKFYAYDGSASEDIAPNYVFNSSGYLVAY